MVVSHIWWKQECSTCKLYKITELSYNNDTQLSGFLVFKTEGIAYCPVTRAASTSWRQNLLLFMYSIQEIENQTHPSELLQKTASYVRMADWKERLKGKNLTTFITVRHPFYRLVSAFTSLFEIGIETCITRNATYILDLRQMMIRIFRPKAKNAWTQSKKWSITWAQKIL